MVSYQYDAWGKVLPTTGELKWSVGVANPFRYRGCYYDQESGLYYLQNRYYDPVVGRFISADTSSVLTASPMSLTDKNLFSYCDNNPVLRIDVEGDFWMAIGAAIGGLISGGLELGSQLMDGKSLSEVNWSKVGTATLTGAISGAFASTGIGIRGQVIANTIISTGGYLADVALKNEKFSVSGLVASGVGGAISGTLGGNGVNGKILQNNWKVAQKKIAEHTVRQSFKYSAKVIAKEVVAKRAIKKVVGVATARFLGGVIASRGINKMVSLIS